MEAPQRRAYLNAFLQDDAHLVAVYRDASGVRRLETLPAEWVCFYERDGLPPERERELRASRYVRSMQPSGRYWRVAYMDRGLRAAMLDERGPFRQEGITAYEGDVRPLERWLADTSPVIAAPRRVYLDIETDSRVSFNDAVEGRARVLSVALVDKQRGLRSARVLAEWSDEAEKQLLQWMWGVLEEYDQVSAWNGDGFDFPVIWARSRMLRLNVNANLWLWIDQMAAFRRLNMHSAESGDEKQSMSLENIGTAITGRGKLVLPEWARAKYGDVNPGAITFELWNDGCESRELLCLYNLQDTDLLEAIEDKTGYLALFQTLCEACGVFACSPSLQPTRQMDGFMLRLGVQRGHHFPTRAYYEGVEQFRGAYVMQPRTHGVATGVHVVDFKSLYPSIILTFNMSPDTKRLDVAVNGPIPEGVARTPTTGCSFGTAEEGILVAALRELIRLRDFWKKKKASLPPGTPEWHDADRKSTAYKVAANSFYGVVSSMFSRFYDREIGEAITQTAVWLIKQTIAAAEARGWRAVYSDTDSVYVMGCNEDEFRAFTEWCNKELYPQIITAQGCVENHIKLAYEKELARLVMVSAKRYCASYSHYEGKRATAESKPEIKGLEYKRGDALKLARDLQAEVIDLLVGGLKIAKGPTPTDDLARYNEAVARMRHRVLAGPMTVDDVKLSKSLTKRLSEYSSRPKKDGTPMPMPPHVAVAHILAQRGQEVRQGTRVDYVVTDGSVSPMRVVPAADFKEGVEADRYYLWEALVFPPTMRLLEAAFPMTAPDKKTILPEHDWSRWLRARPRTTRANRVLPGQTAMPGFLDQRIEAFEGAAKPMVVYGYGGGGTEIVEPLRVAVPSSRMGTPELLALDALCATHPGDRPVVIVVTDADGVECEYGSRWRVSDEDELEAALSGVIGGIKRLP